MGLVVGRTLVSWSVEAKKWPVEPESRMMGGEGPGKVYLAMMAWLATCWSLWLLGLPLSYSTCFASGVGLWRLCGHSLILSEGKVMTCLYMLGRCIHQLPPCCVQLSIMASCTWFGAGLEQSALVCLPRPCVQQ